MLPLQPRQQKIHVTCLVEHEGQVLLLRGSQYADTASSRTIGYFGLPRFTLGFGHNPAELIAKELETQFGQPIEDAAIVDVSERLADSHIHAVELIYRVTIASPVTSQTGRFLFAGADTLEQYVMPTELTFLRKLLDD